MAWLSRFLQPEQNFFNHLLTVQWSIAPWPFTQQMFWFASVVLWPSLNLEHRSLQIRLCCKFISVALKSHRMKQCTTCQHTNYHNTTNHSRHLLWFELLLSCDIHAANWHVKILLDFWLTLVLEETLHGIIWNKNFYILKWILNVFYALYFNELIYRIIPVNNNYYYYYYHIVMIMYFLLFFNNWNI